jgi:hypothetical protein
VKCGDGGSFFLRQHNTQLDFITEGDLGKDARFHSPTRSDTP